MGAIERAQKQRLKDKKRKKQKKDIKPPKKRGFWSRVGGGVRSAYDAYERDTDRRRVAQRRSKISGYETKRGVGLGKKPLRRKKGIQTIKERRAGVKL